MENIKTPSRTFWEIWKILLAAKRRAADDEWGYTPHSGTGHCVHFRGLSEFIEVSELDRKLVNVIWPKYVYYGL